MRSIDAGRRRFLRTASLLSPLGAAAPFAVNLAAVGAASAQAATDYRALVCVFMFGGNDQGNTVLATDPDSWAAYRGLRASASTSLALDAPGASGGVLEIVPSTPQSGRNFAIHPSMGPMRRCSTTVAPR
ncbi:MAG: hypothetical protein R3E48_13690 [Burkholderiaceae bacterium]